MKYITLCQLKEQDVSMDTIVKLTFSMVIELYAAAFGSEKLSKRLDDHKIKYEIKEFSE